LLRRGWYTLHIALILAGPVVSEPLALAAARAHEDAAPEPSGYWTGPINSAVPHTIAGGSVIHASRLSVLLNRGATVVDVSGAPRRPDNMATGAPWLPLPHQAIPGAIWIPGAGLGDIPASVDKYYRDRLSIATGNDLNHVLVIYCHERCWLSWNGAKRAISYGYRKVYWFPDGIEGWRAAGHKAAVIQPEPTPGASAG
jgi:PQQ-dependent catabolism-associated CXXCW motif protein